MPSMNAYLDDFGKVTVHINRNFYGGRSESFHITGDKGYSTQMLITGIEEHSGYVRYNLTCPAGLVFGTSYHVREAHGLSVPLEYRMIVNTQQFNDRFFYNGDDLGATYHWTHTDFALWAPTAVSVTLRIRNHGTLESYPMNRGDKGVWRRRIITNLKYATYTYFVERNGEVVECVDPYGISSIGNGRESAVIDLDEISRIQDYPLEEISGTDAVIYEANVRDMTSSSLTGTDENGTFGALSQENTSYENMPTGLSYLASLGVTHVQLMPVMDYCTVDEFHTENGYNWGYDPMQFITPEGSYSSDPDNPYARVRELKTLVCRMHKHGLRVNLDVVFNHLYNVETSSFHAVLPYYYFRYNSGGFLSNGTYCGNDFASEKPMVRKFIIDAVRRIMSIYGIDGMRFDLMGILDIDTMNAVRETIQSVKPSAMLYGEGWDMPTILDSSLKATIQNQDKMPGIGHFNDFFRDMIKGKTSDDQKYVKGYVTGDLGLSFGTLSALCGNVLNDPFYMRFDSPDKSINGIETHDNSTAWDKMHACCSNEDRATRQKRQKLMIACTMVAQGVPFIHAGFEFAGTKRNNSNSYNAGDHINQMDWRRAVYNSHLIEYTKKAIALRKKYRGFRLHFARQIEKYVRLSVAEGGVIFYEITCSDTPNETEVLKVIINPTFDDKYYNFEPGWKIIFDENGGAREDTFTEVRVPALSLYVLAK